MPDIFPDDRKAKRLDGRLHRVGNVADPAARVCRGNSLFKRQFCRVEQALPPPSEILPQGKVQAESP